MVGAGGYGSQFDNSGSGVLASCKTIYLLSYHRVLPSDVKILRGKKMKEFIYLALEFLASAPTYLGHRNLLASGIRPFYDHGMKQGGRI